MLTKVKLAGSLILTAATATGVLAHTGDHGGMSPSDLVGHFFEPDHILFASLTAAASIVAYRAGRRAEARSAKAARHREEKR